MSAEKHLTVDDLLTNRHAMDRFIHSLAHFNITNRDGGSFRQVRLCYWRAGILFVSNHHVDDSCSIKIASDPAAECFSGCQDSRAYGSAHPSLERGEWVTVWSDGKWEKEGPWGKPITDLIADLIERLSHAQEKRAKEEAESKAKWQAERVSKEAELLKAWQPGASPK